MEATPLPKPNFISNHLESVDIDGLFDQIAKGLEKYDKRQQEEDRNRSPSQSAPLRKAVAATKSAAPTRSDAKNPPNAPRSAPSSGSSHSLPKVTPAPAPMKFDPPRFTFGASTSSSASASQSSKGSVEEDGAPAFKGTADETACNSGDYLQEETSARTDEGDASHLAARTEGSSELPSVSPQDQSETKGTKSWEKRSAFMFDADSFTDQNYMFGFGMSPFPAPMMFGRKYSKEQVDNLVAFAHKWIPDPKKRRMGEKK